MVIFYCEQLSAAIRKGVRAEKNATNTAYGVTEIFTSPIVLSQPVSQSPFNVYSDVGERLSWMESKIFRLPSLSKKCWSAQPG